MRQARLPRTGDHAPQRLDELSGASRALNRLQRHREQQAARVEPALAVLAEKRKHIAGKRVERWFTHHADQRAVPGRIRRLMEEVAA